MLPFHLGAIAALFFFSWAAGIVALALHLIAINLGIVGWHRLLTHRGYRHARPTLGRHAYTWWEFDPKAVKLTKSSPSR